MRIGQKQISKRKSSRGKYKRSLLNNLPIHALFCNPQKLAILPASGATLILKRKGTVWYKDKSWSGVGGQREIEATVIEGWDGRREHSVKIERGRHPVFLIFSRMQFASFTQKIRNRKKKPRYTDEFSKKKLCSVHSAQ